MIEIKLYLFDIAHNNNGAAVSLLTATKLKQVNKQLQIQYIGIFKVGLLYKSCVHFFIFIHLNIIFFPLTDKKH